MSAAEADDTALIAALLQRRGVPWLLGAVAAASAAQSSAAAPLTPQPQPPPLPEAENGATTATIVSGGLDSGAPPSNPADASPSSIRPQPAPPPAVAGVKRHRDSEDAHAEGGNAVRAAARARRDGDGDGHGGDGSPPAATIAAAAEAASASKPAAARSRGELRAAADGRFYCPHPGCSKNFSLVNNLRRHMVTHADTLPHECPSCGKGYTRSDDLTHHMATHADPRAFACMVPPCSRRFDRLAELLEHQRAHTLGKLSRDHVPALLLDDGVRREAVQAAEVAAAAAAVAAAAEAGASLGPGTDGGATDVEGADGEAAAAADALALGDGDDDDDDDDFQPGTSARTTRTKPRGSVHTRAARMRRMQAGRSTTVPIDCPVHGCEMRWHMPVDTITIHAHMRLRHTDEDMDGAYARVCEARRLAGMADDELLRVRAPPAAAASAVAAAGGRRRSGGRSGSFFRGSGRAARGMDFGTTALLAAADAMKLWQSQDDAIRAHAQSHSDDEADAPRSLDLLASMLALPALPHLPRDAVDVGQLAPSFHSDGLPSTAGTALPPHALSALGSAAAAAAAAAADATSTMLTLPPPRSMPAPALAPPAASRLVPLHQALRGGGGPTPSPSMRLAMPTPLHASAAARGPATLAMPPILHQLQRGIGPTSLAPPPGRMPDSTNTDAALASLRNFAMRRAGEGGVGTDSDGDDDGESSDGGSSDGDGNGRSRSANLAMGAGAGHATTVRDSPTAGWGGSGGSGEAQNVVHGKFGTR